MTAPAFDTHAHLQLGDFDPDRDEVVARANQSGVVGILVLGVDAETSARAVELAARHRRLHAAVGYHPHDTKDLTDERWQMIETLAHDPRVVAVGEIGLDFYRNLSPHNVQVEVFERQLELASEIRKPVCVHGREAHDALLPILRSWSNLLNGMLPDGRPLGVMHYFSGDVDLARRYIELGFLISVHTSVTYPNAGRLQQVAAELPLEALVVETDSPYGAPQSRRGRRNEPENVRDAIEKVAALRDEPVGNVAQATTANALRLFAPARQRAHAAGSSVR